VSRHDDSLTVRQARQRYFEQSGFDESSYEDRWVKLQAGPIALYIPNSAARVRAVKLHDLHHPATEYDTTWTGEAEIAAWEIGSGCAHHYAAWILNLQAWAIGLFLAPVRVLRALVRGRSSLNLYRSTIDDALLAQTMGELRRRLRLDQPVPRANLSDILAFAAWSVLSLVTLAATLAPLLVVIGLLAYVIREC
jgi:hypothetical protein